MFCPNCGSENADNARFCCRCGSATVQNGKGSDDKIVPLMEKSKDKLRLLFFVIVIIIVVVLGYFIKLNNSNKETGNVRETSVSDVADKLTDKKIKAQNDDSTKESQSLVDEVERDINAEDAEANDKKIEHGDYISGWIEKRHREADPDSGGYDYDYYILVCEIPYILEIETEEGSYVDRFIEILPRCEEGIERYDRCFIECRIDSAWENLVHGPTTGDRSRHVIVDVSDIDVLMAPATMEPVAEEIYDLSKYDSNNADLTGSLCKVYQFLGCETDSEGKTIYSLDLVYENVCDVIIADKSGNTYKIDQITDVQLVISDVEKQDLQLKIGAIVGVTGRLYKTTTEDYVYDVYMEVEEIE